MFRYLNKALDFVITYKGEPSILEAKVTRMVVGFPIRNIIHPQVDVCFILEEVLFHGHQIRNMYSIFNYGIINHSIGILLPRRRMVKECVE